MPINSNGGQSPPHTTNNTKDFSNGNNNYITNLGFNKFKWVIISTFVLLAYLHYYHYTILVFWFNLVGAIVVIIVLSGVCLLVWFTSEKIKIVRASRISLEKEAHTMTIVSEGQVFLRDTAKHAPIKALHLQTNYSNSGYNSHNTEVWEKFITRNKATAPAPMLIDNCELDTLTDTPPNIMDIVKTSDRTLVRGASDSGKTNILQHIANSRLKKGDVFIIDPHTAPNKWGKCQVFGGGSDFKAIDKAFISFIDLMVKRYKELAKGAIKEIDFTPVTIIIDEYMSIAYQCKNAKDTIVRLLTESRKANFSLFVGTHSDRVESLGLRGKGDLRDGFTVLRLYNNNGVRQVTFDVGNGENEAINVNKFDTWDNIQKPSQLVLLPPKISLSSDDIKIKELRNKGYSYNKIALEVFGNKGGKQVRDIKASLAKSKELGDNKSD